MMAAAAAAIALATALQVGDLVTFRYPGTTDALCTRVVSLDTGPGDIPIAWVVEDGTPARLWRARVADLRPGCPAPK